MGLIEQVRGEIERRHLTQREAADEIGVSLRTMSAWLNGEVGTPRPRFRRAIVAWLERDQVAA